MEDKVEKLAQYANGLRVLLVEDDNDVRLETADFLSDFFYKVDTAINGNEGLLKYKKNDYDIVISDIKMPGMDGVEMVKEIRSLSKEQKIIIFSAHDNSEYLLELINADVDKFIMKPFDNQKLLFVLMQVCKVIVNEKDLHIYRSNLEAIFKSVKDAIITVDKELNVIETNKAVKNICNFSGIEAKGRPFSSLLNSCKGTCLKALAETIETKRPFEMKRFECKSGKQNKQVASLSTFPLLDSNNRFNGCVMVVKDETRLDNLENKMKVRGQFHNIIGKSKKMQRIYTLIEALSDTQTTVLITGENGTGKELVAEAIHYHKNGKKPFVVVNCVAISQNLVESELFGHVKGSFTGSTNLRIGKFEMADGGTIFLDEIADISKEMQLRLLRVLQEKEIERVGESRPIKVNVRIITATNQDLRKRIRLGTFREDLYHRLKVLELAIPPLRDRREDIPALVEFFRKKFNKKFNKNIEGISREVENIFNSYNWPGNIRELQHCMEAAYVLCTQSIMTINDLPDEIKDCSKISILTEIEKEGIDQEIVVKALERTLWNKTKAARLLGISRMTMYLKIKKYNLVENQVI